MINKIKYKEFTQTLSYLIPFEFSQLPFTPQRMFMVSMYPGGERIEIRGQHASKENKQFIYCTSGSFQFEVHGQEEGEVFTRHVFNLEQREGFYLPNRFWVSYSLSDNENIHNPPSELISFCSHPYDKNDYFKNYEEFYKEIRGLND